MNSTPSDGGTRAPQPHAPVPPSRRRRRWRRGLGAAALLVAAYALFGFLLAPRLLAGALRTKGSAALHRTVSVAGVKVNPFTLSVSVLGLDVSDRDAPRLAGWDALHVRLAPWKVLRGDVGIAEIRLVRPFGRVALDAAGRLNVQDLLDGDRAAPTPRAEEKEPALGVALDRLEIEDARVVFEDATRSPRFQTTVGPLTIRLSDFRTRGGADSRYAFTGTTEAGETFSWSGTVLSGPLRSSGALSFSGVTLPKYDPYSRADAPALLVSSGTVSVDARYALEWGAAAQRLAVTDLRVVVEDLALERRRDRSEAVRVPRIELSGGAVDLVRRVASVAEVKVSGARLRPRREADGTMALLEMLERPPRAEPSRPAGEAAPPWTWTVAAVSLERLSVEAEDAVPPRPVHLVLPEVNARLTGLAGRPDVACPLTASIRWGEKGRVAVTGTVWPLAARADLEIRAEALDLAPLGPYLDDAAPLRLAAAQLGLSARATVDARGASPAWTFAGDVRLDALSLRHPTRAEEVVRWRALELEGLEVSSEARAAVKVVRLVEPRLRAIVFEDGTTSLGASPGARATPPAPPPAASAPRGQEARPAWRTAIARFQLTRGQASFVDRSVAPPVVVALTGIEARIANLSSDPRIRSTVDVRARVDGAAPVTVTGTVNPLQALAHTDLAISARGVDLTPLDPYAGKHLGYGLRKGKLDLDLAYQVRDRALEAGNVIRVDQLTLGDATGSPEATSLPVRLGLALLRDKDGVILLDVPVEGRTDDPEFRLGRVIWHAVLNVMVKVATSPFKALASLVGGGGGEDLSQVDFAPGSAELDEVARRRLDVLARSLAQRPGVTLELEGTADPVADAAALRRAALERRLREAKAAAQRPPSAADAVQVTADERPRLIEALFRAGTAAPAAAVATTTAVPAATAAPVPAAAPPAPLASPAAMEDSLLAAEAVAPEALVALAAARTAAARDALLAAGVDPARLFAVEGGVGGAAEQGGRARFTVK